VGQSAFLEVFESAEDCILASFSEGLQRLSEAVAEATASEERWLERIRAGLVAALGFLEDEPQWAHLLILERPLEGVAAIECTQRVHDALEEVLNAGRGELIIGAELGPSTALIAELVALGVFSVIRARMLKGDASGLVELAPSLMSFILVPYLARGAVKADLAGEPQLAAQAPARAEVVPIRPHPRTMLALGLIAQAPGQSSREIAVALGIKPGDKGHTSTLLKPLEQRGLIENASLVKAPGEPNAWLLTPYGHRVLEVISDSFAAARRREGEEEPPGRASHRPPAQLESEHGRIGRRAA
jgi:AcrR family transcriptional regulator